MPCRLRSSSEVRSWLMGEVTYASDRRGIHLIARHKVVMTKANMWFGSITVAWVFYKVKGTYQIKEIKTIFYM